MAKEGSDKIQEITTMKDLAESFSNRLVPFKNGEIIEVKVQEILKSKIVVDVAGFCVGIIPEREFSPDMSEVKVDEKILAYVLTLENSEGNCILSLRRADKEKVSKILDEKFTAGGVLTVKCSDANRGGLLCSFGDYEGFLPVSQLSSSHYPKVSSGDKEEILGKLRQFVGQNFQVKILSFEPANNKLIFSEKAAGDIVQQEKIKKYKVGDELDGEITGIVDFGLFINLGEIEGLVHISEAAWEHVESLKDLFKVGEKVKVVIISIENNRISLSIKRLTPDPWIKSVEKYKIGADVKGEVTRITPYGAFVSLGEVGGLVHVSEMGEKVTNPSEVLEVGKSYNFKIISVEPEIHKLSLSMKDSGAPKEKKSAKKSTKEEK
ncbi:TPA: 30S ribosomal protein S1 [Candidatus Berkelbacteria bacterium]|uniref:30S ribosomal protein S1 n=1 Tax=Berkelbacteria bacterium GW2011_GWE1_39_12 TaxID=1618337 RepID=A0A0G4B4Y7_9BACT|nr:MAG: 30S ribosomal protein S1 [Berkelbacteria bacterium GW2011_GWE1_39_12]HBO61065.1 30S ribosomal protein S1 [Candidatus Berkelbacteria bacterium]